MDDRAFRLNLLDRFSFARGGSEQPLGPSQERLLAFLAVHPWPSRYVIAGMLWPDSAEDAALAALRTAIWRLQHHAPGVLEAGARTLSLSNSVSVDVHDCVTWAQAVLCSTERLSDAELTPPEVGSELLPGWYDDWLEPERQRVHQLRVHALETVADEYLVRGHPGRALVAACAALREDPLRESSHRALVRVHLAEGNVAAALTQYDRCRRLLTSVVGVTPSDALAALVAPYLSR